MPWLVCGSRFPVGSSASRISGPVDEGAGDGDALLLSTRELARQVVRLLGQPDQVEDLGYLVGHHVPGTADHLEREGHVLEHRLVREEPEVLEDTTDVAAEVRHPPFGQVDDVATGLPDLAVSGSSSRSSSRMNVVLPEPEDPTRKTNSPLSISTDMSRRATVDPL